MKENRKKTEIIKETTIIFSLNGGGSFDWVFKEEANILIVIEVLISSENPVGLVEQTDLSQRQINNAVSNINIRLRKELGIEHPILTIKGSKAGFNKFNVYSFSKSLKISSRLT
jgi:hypothetical protein